MAEQRVDDRQVNPRRKWIALGVLALGLSMIVIDGTIVGVSLPVIITDLGLDLNDAQWVNSLYSVVFAALLLTAGRLGDRLGRRRLFIAGVAVFLAGSLLAATADSVGWLIGARAVQGVGGALVLPATLSSVNAVFRGRDRVIAFAVWGAVISGMAAVGPLLGGWLTTSFTWPWIFLVNVPVSVIVVAGALWVVPETQARITEPGLDVDGLLLSAVGFGAVVFAVIEGPTLGWWSAQADLTIAGLTWPQSAPVSAVPVIGIIGLLFLGLFGLWERHRARVGRSAILDLNLFFTPTFSWGNLTAMMVAIGEFGLIFVLPLFLINVLALSTLGAGFVLAAMAGGAFASAGAARPMAAKIGAARVVMVGLALEVIGIVALALVLGSGVSAWLVGGLLVIYGAGLGLASAQLTGMTLRDIPAEESGQGSATQSTVRQLGAALGTAIAGAILSVGVANAAHTHLQSVEAVPAPVAQSLTNATRDSAGGVIEGLRQQGTAGGLGAAEPQVVAALSDGFSDATRYALFGSGVFLLLGLAGASRVVATAQKSPAAANRATR